MDDEIQETGYEQPAQEVPQQRTIEVVSYDVVRNTVEGVADDAAALAADSVASRQEAAAQLVADSVDDVASKAADEAAGKVLRGAAQDEAKGTRDASTTQTVQLDSTQWQYVHDQLQLQSALQAFSLFMLCACLGAILSYIFVERFRT